MRRRSIEWQYAGGCVRCTSHRLDAYGYPAVRRDDRLTKICRLLLFRRHGELPIIPGSRRDNSLDMVSRGRSARGGLNGHSKLTDHAVSVIRKSDDTHLNLARQFGVARQTVSKAKAGLTWKHIVSIFLLIPSIAFAGPRHHHPTPTPNPSPSSAEAPTRADLLRTVDHIVILSQDLQRNLDQEKAAHENTEIGLRKANKENSDLQRRIDNDTRDFNATIEKLSAASKKLWWYRIHFFLGWVLLITGIAACGFFAFLKFTGRLAVLGTAVAAKLP